MWKCTSKIFIEILRKNLRKSNTVFTTKVSQHNNLDCFLRLTPALLTHFNRYYGFYKKNCGNCSKGKNREETNKKKPSFLDNLDQTIFDALSLGAVCVLGYIFVAEKKLSYFGSYDRQSASTLSNYRKTIQFLAGSIKVQPFNYVFPEVQAAKTRRNCKNVTEEQYTEKSEFEEDENINAFEKAHKKVFGTLNNWLGTQYMESGDYKEALKFFNRATSEENPAGIFNLGICHERGLGTSQNFEKAAELYQKAANLGHPSAMYNLGVFYVRGLGGIRADENHAKKLFREAAKLGQSEAVKALSLEQEILGDSPITDIPICKKTKSSVTELISDKSFNFKSKKAMKNYDHDEKKNDINELLYYLGEKNCDSSLNSDSGVLDLSPSNDLEL